MITLKRRISLNKRIDEVIVINLDNSTDLENSYNLNYLEYYQYDAIKNHIANKNDRYIVIHKDKTFEIYNNINDVLEDYKNFSMFTKNDRSSFKYWFAHWCGFQLTALNLGIWKPKYLFHDAEKPWLKLLWKGNYKRVQKWHRTHNSHHLEYGLLHGWDNIDWCGLMIDWECCGLSKREAQLDARETMEYEVKKDKWKPYENEIRSHLEPILNKYHM